MIAEITAESDRHWGVVRTAVAKGARIALGTDFHPPRARGTWAVVRELELYAEAGVTGRDLLASRAARAPSGSGSPTMSGWSRRLHRGRARLDGNRSTASAPSGSCAGSWPGAPSIP
jgi:hypothetical protein